MPLFWHRRDLRLPDNRGLARAAEQGTVVPVFVFDPNVLKHASPPRVAFMLDALEAVRAAYRQRGSDLLTVRGRPAEQLPLLAATHDVDTVIYNADYSGLARTRDAAVDDALDTAGIETERVQDQLMHAPGSITTNAGDHYSVFSYFWRKWRERPKSDPVATPSAVALADCSGSSLPTQGELGFDDLDATIPPAGTEAARDRLETFCTDSIYQYMDRRDAPAADGTSRLSAHLKWGTIGIREVYERTVAAMAAAPDETAEGSVEEFQSQLAWREFYTHVLRYNPSVVTENFKTYEQPIQWREDPDALAAWRAGETGFPIVDAGMRQLREEAWMHNRVRMIVASFLTKDLLLDWRVGYDWFRERLVDHDTANDNGGWQWAASTGTDAQPYFRIFNPMTQGERYDPDAEYIKRYVPELEDVPVEAIHEWPELSVERRDELAPEYAAPIVDHADRREAALAMFEAARGDG
ncbi:MAG: deoxyribodipyrimidine photo-lyase [Halobacteriales archaeon]